MASQRDRHTEVDLLSNMLRLLESHNVSLGIVARQQYEQRSMRVDEQQLRSASGTSIESGIGSTSVLNRSTSNTASVSQSDFSMSSPLTVPARQTYLSQTDSDSDTLDEEYNPPAWDLPFSTKMNTRHSPTPRRPAFPLDTVYERRPLHPSSAPCCSKASIKKVNKQTQYSPPPSPFRTNIHSSANFLRSSQRNSISIAESEESCHKVTPENSQTRSKNQMEESSGPLLSAKDSKSSHSSSLSIAEQVHGDETPNAKTDDNGNPETPDNSLTKLQTQVGKPSRRQKIKSFFGRMVRNIGRKRAYKLSNMKHTCTSTQNVQTCDFALIPQPIVIKTDEQAAGPTDGDSFTMIKSVTNEDSTDHDDDSFTSDDWECLFNNATSDNGTLNNLYLDPPPQLISTVER